MSQFDGMPVEELVAGVDRMERLKALFSTDVGTDLKNLVAEVAQEFMDEALAGEPAKLHGVAALQRLVQYLDLAIVLGSAMRAEIVSRQLSQQMKHRNSGRS